MHAKGIGLALTLGVGMAAGAVAVLMLPRSCSARKLAARAANKVEDAAWAVSDRLSELEDGLDL